MTQRLEYLTYNSSETWTFPGLNDFVHWLSQFESDTVIAKDWTSKGCPLWHFLRYHGWENPTIYGHGYWHPSHQDGVTEEFALPSWAAEFSWWEDKLFERTLTAIACVKLIHNPHFNPSKWENGNSRPTLGRCIGI